MGPSTVWALSRWDDAHRTTPARCPITTSGNRVAHCPRTPVKRVIAGCLHAAGARDREHRPEPTTQRARSRNDVAAPAVRHQHRTPNVAPERRRRRRRDPPRTARTSGRDVVPPCAASTPPLLGAVQHSEPSIAAARERGSTASRGGGATSVRAGSQATTDRTPWRRFAMTEAAARRRDVALLPCAVCRVVCVVVRGTVAGSQFTSMQIARAMMKSQSSLVWVFPTPGPVGGWGCRLVPGGRCGRVRCFPARGSWSPRRR
jgi:hypothetical protein